MDVAIAAFTTAKVPIVQLNDDNYREYEKAVVTSNLLFRFTRPPVVVQPETAAHVQSVIKQVKAQKLLLTIRCGGHSYAGFSTALEKNNILVDLRKMNKVRLNVKEDTITIDAGCQWGEVYRTLINGDHNGFIINGGRCPYVGVGGFILGSGLGPFTRTFGMGSDTLLEATLVTADGNLVTVGKSDDPKSDKGRLFWALQGAGQANFGVVTQMKLKIQHLNSKNGWVVGGRFLWFPGEKDMGTLLPTMNEFYKVDWPKEMTIDSTWICDLRQKPGGDGVRFTVYYDGSKEDYDALIKKHIKNETVQKQLIKRALPEPSTRFLYETLEEQWFDESKKFFAENKTYRVFTSFVFTRKEIDKNVEEITRILKGEMETFRALYPEESVNLDIVWIHTGGHASTVSKPTETAFFWREALYHTYVEVLWQDKWMELNMRGFMSRLRKKLRPFSLNKAAAFLNFPDRDLVQAGYERAYFGDNRQELRRIKEIWDKDNLFKWAQGIQLPKDAVDDESADVDPDDARDQTDQIAQDLWDKRNWQHKVVRDIGAAGKKLEAMGF
ncbi:FAD linked oxidase, N-terminal [Penicillium expansum]|uniref:FAD linked oxidase, N-terminal n=1 Tax=Penicillium expansum TaxID=27334 RepID=A0A0A2I6Y4_PENEN|nr:FAD linked oxidase, N-terminal [Penicillium expansum]KGO38829.1 FAD linked oxidase, N-terminal [Penicillium expansum]KGO54708.1 FAD linked oxidase, N-terminal [Penicillium expansum]